MMSLGPVFWGFEEAEKREKFPSIGKKEQKPLQAFPN
jgi:hypothetical protein